MIPLRVVGGIAAGVALSAFALGAARFGPAAPAQPAAPAAAPAAVQSAVQPRRAFLAPEAAPARAPALAAAHGAAARAAPVPARASLPQPAVPAGSGEAYRGRVAAGVLARAASLRAQDRDAACVPPTAEAAAAQKTAGTIESVEIDWNAGPQDP